MSSKASHPTQHKWAQRLCGLIGLLGCQVPAHPASAQPVENPPPAAVAVASPHWSASSCGTCHTSPAGDPISTTAIDALCVSCHNGRLARAERHPIGRTFASAQLTLPDGWPVVDGALSCRTCHDIRLACSPSQARPADNPAFLRGVHTGGRESFCANCHVPGDAHALHNPHRMLTADRTIVETSCRFCHSDSSELTGRTTRSGQAQLRVQEPVLCLSCHREHLDYFEPGHLGMSLKPQMLASWPRDAEGRSHPHELPLMNGTTISCTTCHNPHQQGVFVQDSPLSQGAIRFDDGSSGKGLRRPGTHLCAACHSPSARSTSAR